MATVIAYCLTIGAVLFAATAIPIALLGGALGRAVGLPLASLLAGLIVWIIIDVAWTWLEGGHIPIAVLAGVVVVLLGHMFLAHRKLNSQAQLMLAAEAWAAIVLGLILLVVPDNARWY